MNTIIDIDGRKAITSVDPEIGMMRGEFLDLSSGADFYATSGEALETEGRKSPAVYFLGRNQRQLRPRSVSGRSSRNSDAFPWLKRLV